MRLTHFVFITILIAGFAVNAHAANNAQSELIQDLMQKAEQGDADAQFQLGDFFFSGQYTMPEIGKALTYYGEAAAQEHVAALGRLGYIYLHGVNVQADEQRAFEYLQRADIQGDAASAFNLGYTVLTGGFVKQVTEDREARGMRWIHDAAGDGYGPAQFTLGEAYLKGIVVDVNLPRALKLFNEALDNEIFDAGKLLGEQYAQGTGVSQDIGKAIGYYAKALELARAAQAGTRTLALFSFRLAELHELASSPQLSEATRLYKEAAGHDIQSIANLANIRLARLAIAHGDVDRIKATQVKVFDAALVGSAPATCLVIETLEKGGTGLHHDPEMAEQWTDKLNDELLSRQGLCPECSLKDDREKVCSMTRASSTPLF